MDRKLAKILCIDDSSVFLDLLVYSLNDGGYIDIDAVESPLDALKLIEITKYDLILVDLHMPEINGIELIEKIRKKIEYIKTPILMITSEHCTEIKYTAKSAGATGWIVKPFYPKQLIKAIDMCTHNLVD
jgi:two-component system, chemotaxis family, chemotaxis protein CheY